MSIVNKASTILPLVQCTDHELMQDIVWQMYKFVVTGVVSIIHGWLFVCESSKLTV